MKHLKINNKQGEFSLNGSSFKSIDKITKDDILELLQLALNEDHDFEMDAYSDEAIEHKAHKIIYKNLHDKFVQLKGDKSKFVEDINALYEDEYNEYKSKEVAEAETVDMSESPK